MKHHEDEDSNFDAAAAELVTRVLGIVILFGLGALIIRLWILAP